VVGARPNFVKAAPVIREMSRFGDDFAQLLLHTGQHYDPKMSQVFFEELDLPKPDINLEVGSGTHSWQTAQIMERFEPIVGDFQPHWVIVYGDVNSTLACSVVCSKLGTPVAHVEAGLRSFDRSMPEEVNRIITDQLSDLLFTPGEEANHNLEREGIDAEKIHLVGNVMIDTLVNLIPKAEARWPDLAVDYPYDRYLLVTIHRNFNVDDPVVLADIMAAIDEFSKEMPVLFPIHPRTQQRIKEFNLQPENPQFIIMEPIGYLDFLALQSHATLVLTDSGGIQEETTYLNIPCLTVRPNTERPVTVTHGTNQLVDHNKKSLLTTLYNQVRVPPRPRFIPPLWDGQSAKRIVKIFLDLE
jgi:UDP-N-acetylglucosamine 2-epimerase (non-hydrolysing)